MYERIPPEALLASVPPPIAALADELRAAVRAAVPDVIEAVRTGWAIIGYDAPAGRRSAYFAWVWPEQVHVHLGFVYGVSMDDPARLLHGDAKLARWLTFGPGDRLDPGALAPLVREARRVALLSRTERAARALDADAAPPD